MKNVLEGKCMKMKYIKLILKNVLVICDILLCINNNYKIHYVKKKYNNNIKLRRNYKDILNYIRLFILWIITVTSVI